MFNPLRDKLRTLNAEELANLYKTIFTSEAGQLVLEDLRNRSFYYIPTFECSYGKDAAEGMRNIVMSIETQINYEPEPKDDDVVE